MGLEFLVPVGTLIAVKLLISHTKLVHLLLISGNSGVQKRTASRGCIGLTLIQLLEHKC